MPPTAIQIPLSPPWCSCFDPRFDHTNGIDHPRSRRAYAFIIAATPVVRNPSLNPLLLCDGSHVVKLLLLLENHHGFQGQLVLHDSASTLYTLPQLPCNKPRRHAPSASAFFFPGRGILVWLDSFHDKVKTNMSDLTGPVRIATSSLHLVCQVLKRMATSTGMSGFDLRVEAGDAFGTNSRDHKGFAYGTSMLLPRHLVPGSACRATGSCTSIRRRPAV